MPENFFKIFSRAERGECAYDFKTKIRRDMSVLSWKSENIKFWKTEF